MKTIRLTLRRRRRSDQRGFTLVEILAALAIIAMVMVPVTGWALLSMRQHSEVEDRSTTSASAGLLRSYFMADVASASSIDAATGSACGDGSGVLYFPSGAPGDGTVYALDAMVDLDGTVSATKQSLWRRECVSGSPVQEVQVVEGVLSGGVDVTCDPGPTDCLAIRLSVTRTDDPAHPIILSAQRRVM